MEDIKTLYAIHTMKCNLNCPHCFIKDTPEIFNRDEFIKQLNSFRGEIVMFGGEPTSNLERMFDVINANKDGVSRYNSVSTNLIILNDDLLEFYKSIHHVATSWNPSRFDRFTYKTWMNNCKVLSDNGIDYMIMITLTDDLFDIPVLEFVNIASEWYTDSLTCIKFEHYIGDDVTKDYFERADKWLCELYQIWSLPIDMEITERLSCWQYDCSNIYTLYPDGTVVNLCPHNKIGTVPEECYTCERVSTCRPCKIQPYCSYPKELSKLVELKRKEDLHG
jgi:sulfatase maturation enzyme AslB (radical SAM superfamily)